MKVEITSHPTPASLQAFRLGELDNRSSEELAQHLEACDECRQQAEVLSEDRFLNYRQHAQRLDGTPPPIKSMEDLAWSNKVKRATTPPKLPPELANHPHYEIQKELGRGGMGVVYLAKNKLMDRLEVLKVVNKAFVESPGAMDRFLREIQSAAKLRHENVVGAYSAPQLGDMLGFAMEYVEGQDLSRVVGSQGPLVPARACHYIRQAALGLQHAYEKGMIHRDIKPQNLILAREGKKHTVKILDFGLAKATRDKKYDSSLTGVGELLGTPDYMAPEQILDSAMADIRSDIYSLGCTMYYLLTGKPPFRAKNMLELLQAHQSAEATPLNLVRPEISAELAAVVAKMMAKDPANRFQKPSDVARALTPFLKLANAARPASSVVARPYVQAAETADFALASETIVTKPSTPGTGKREAAKKGRRPLGIASGFFFFAVTLLAAVILWPTPHGTVRIESDDPNVEIVFDKDGPTIRGANKTPITLRAGPHRLIVSHGDLELAADRFEIKNGEIVTLKVELLKDKIQLTRDGKELASRPLPKTDSPLAKDERKDLSPQAAVPAESQPTGLLVLDDCDDQYAGKNEYKDNLTLWDANGVEKFRISGFNNSQAVGNTHRIAVDPLRKSIWVVEDANRRIRRFDLSGKTTLTINNVQGLAIAVDPETGNAWVVDPNGPGKTLVYDVTGALVASYNVSGLDIVYDRKTRSFWIAYQNLTKINAATGEIQFSTAVAAFCVSNLAIDPRDGSVWATVRGGEIQPNGNRLLKFDAQGKERTRVELGPKNPFAVSVDANDGSVWVVFFRKSIDQFSADGTPLKSHNVAATSVLAAKDGGVWAVTLTDIQKTSPQGEVTIRLKHASNSNQAWITALDLP